MQHEKPLCHQTPDIQKGLRGRLWSGCCSPPAFSIGERPGGTRGWHAGDNGDTGGHPRSSWQELPAAGPALARSEQLARMSQPITSGKEVSGKAVTPRRHLAGEGQMWGPTHVQRRRAAN